MGTVHLLEAVRNSPGVRAVLVVSSDKCYENIGSPRGYREDDRLGGHDPYSNSKGCTELVTAAYRASFFEDQRARDTPTIVSARAGNVIGGGDWAKNRLIPDLIRAFMARQVPAIRSPHAVRPWQHVLEPLSGYLLLLEAAATKGDEFSGGWNFGPAANDARPVSWIADRLVENWGDGACWKLDAETYPHEAAYLYLDSAKARSRLHYRPRWPLEQTLQKLVEWYKAFDAGQDMAALTLTQIEAFRAARPATVD
jgi:CDP-glucose 4,6-dehydratase